MKNTILILLLTLTVNTVQARAQDVWLEVRNATAFEEEFVRKSLDKMGYNIVKGKRDNNFGFDKGVDYDGGIRVTFLNNSGTCFATRKVTAYNIDLEQIVVMSITINRQCIDSYDEINRFYAFQNAVNHEYFCHATTGSSEHTAWGLCRPNLSTDKVYWGKKHRRKLRRDLALPGRTGEALGETQLTRDRSEDTLCEMGIMKKLELY